MNFEDDFPIYRCGCCGSLFSWNVDNIFDITTSILTENEIDYDELKLALDFLHDSYSPEQLKTSNATLVDYDDVLYQCAYIHLYLTSHVNAVYIIFSKFWQDYDFVKDFFQQRLFRRRSFRQRSPSIRICSIGGGPGTDIFALDSFLNEQVGKFKITGNVLERFPAWKNTFYNLKRKLGVDNLRRINYKDFDFFSKTCSPSTIEAISSADVITLVKFVSTVSFKKRFAEVKMMNLLEYVKPGAIVLFVDNSGGGYLKLMNRAATRANLEKIGEVRNQEYCVSPTVSEAMEEAISDDLSPQKILLLAASIWYKRENFSVEF